MADRAEALRGMLARNPDDPRAHFGLAAELEKRGEWAPVVDHLRRYLDLTDDQGNAWGRLAKALLALGDEAGAVDAYHKGIAAARRHGHPSMATDFEDALESLQGE